MYSQTMKRIFTAVERFYWKSGIADDVPALTYYLLVSLLPFSFGLVILGTVLFGDRISPESFTSSVGRLLPDDAQTLILQAIEHAQARSPLLLLLALFAMVWTSSGAIGVIERATARMTQSRRHPALFGRFYNLCLGAALAIIFVGATAAGTVTSGLARELGAGEWFNQMFPYLYFAGAVLLCSCLYRYVVVDRIPWHQAFKGGLTAGVLLQITPVIVAFYVRSTHPSIEQVFLALALLVVVCSLLAMALLIGAGVAAQAGRTVVRPTAATTCANQQRRHTVASLPARRRGHG
jgi:uncharacterized BrkB/YihY/UPF0761 family membrane protein